MAFTRTKSDVVAWGTLLAACLWSGSSTAAEVIQFNPAIHGAHGQPTAIITQGGFAATLRAGPAGALLGLPSAGGMGIDSTALIGPPGENTVTLGRFNLVATGPSSGEGEWVTISFNRDGVLRGLLFDGVKDESLEYFRIEGPGGVARTIFDWEVPERLMEDGLTTAALTTPNPFFLTDNSDDTLTLNLPFQAGDVFKMTYGEHPYPQGYSPNTGEMPNGARWQGLVVVPEPTTIGLAAAMVSALARVARGARR